jgi:hypothetical protein
MNECDGEDEGSRQCLATKIIYSKKTQISRFIGKIKSNYFICFWLALEMCNYSVRCTAILFSFGCALPNCAIIVLHETVTRVLVFFRRFIFS